MNGHINITRDTFLEKEELDRMIAFLSDNVASNVILNSIGNWGFFRRDPVQSSDPAFKIEAGTTPGTIKQASYGYGLGEDGNLFYQEAFDNMVVPDDSAWYWLGFVYDEVNYEEGFVNIAADGTLTGNGTMFTEVLRGFSSGFPTKIKLYTQDDDGVLTPATNSGIYEMTSVSNDTAAVLNGAFTPETNLRYVVLGAFSIKTSVGNITSTGLYSYNSCLHELIAETVADTEPAHSGYYYFAARVRNVGGTVTIQDKRADYYISFKVDVYDAYTEAEIDAKFLLQTVVDIGDWDMTDSDTFAGVNLTWASIGVDKTKVRRVTCFIRADADVSGVPVCSIDSIDGIAGITQGYLTYNATGITLKIDVRAPFNSVSYNSLTYNRGWVVIDHVA